MKTYLVMRALANDKKIKRIIVRSFEKNAKGMSVAGNLPELYNGMFINLELDGQKVIDYSLQLNKKNISILKKNEIDIDLYAKTLEQHKEYKEKGYSWQIAKVEINNIYEELGWQEGDKVHKERVNNATDPLRMNALNKKVLENARRRRKINHDIEEYLSYIDEAERNGAYHKLLMSMRIALLNSTQYGFKNGTITDNEMKEKEDFINRDIISRKNHQYQLLEKDEIKTFIDNIDTTRLAKEQIDVLNCLEDSCPCIITGGAGTGKTTVIKTIIGCYTKYYKHGEILLVAPTGKASRRLEESTGLTASTIHKALKKSLDNDFTFYNHKNRLPHRLIIVDESSMVDTELMYDLLRAVDSTSKVIFVGDHNQLYPVGYGEPFFDFMSKIPVFRLTENHRQSDDTDILANAMNVLEDKPLFNGKGIFIEEISFDDIGDKLIVSDDTQLLSPYNDLNSQINEFLKKGDNDFNVGDKILTIKNTEDYCNGDIGYIKKIDKDGFHIQIDNKSVIVPYKNKYNLMLAYSITIHKMQGSEADFVVVFLPKDKDLVDKRLLYTAITRAKKGLKIYYYSD